MNTPSQTAQVGATPSDTVNFTRWLAVGSLIGLLKNRMYAYRWVSLMVWLYFTEGTVRAYSDRAPSNYYAFAEAVLCLALFTACALHVRLAHAKTAAPAELQA